MSATDTIDYYSIFQHAPVGMVVSQNRRIVSCNQALCQMFAYDAVQLIDASFSVLYPSNDEFERTGARIAPILNTKGWYSDERIMKRANQELFWCHVSGRALQQNDGHASGIWTFEDLSDKRSVSAALTPREREIAAQLVLGQTSKNIARELNLSPRTIEMHRAKLMRKLNAISASDLVNKLLRIAS